MTKGNLSVKKDMLPVIQYQPEGSDKEIPLYVASSIVSEISPLLLVLKSGINFKAMIIEEPEAHLHPRGQRKIGELVALAAANGVQIFMETHSNHVLNGILLSVRNKKISSDKVKINYFYEYLSEEGIQKHEKTSPEILEDGSLSNWPEGFFDEWDKAIDELF